MKRVGDGTFEYRWLMTLFRRLACILSLLTFHVFCPPTSFVPVPDKADNNAGGDTESVSREPTSKKREGREASVSSQGSNKRQRTEQEEAGGNAEEEEDEDTRNRYSLRRGRGNDEGPVELTVLPPPRRSKGGRFQKQRSNYMSAGTGGRQEPAIFTNFNNFQPPQEFYTSPNPFLANFSLSVDSLLFCSNRLERRREDLRPMDPLTSVLDMPDRAELGERVIKALAENETLKAKLNQVVSPTWTMATQIRAYETKQRELKAQYDELFARMESIRHLAQQNEDDFLQTEVKREGGKNKEAQSVRMMDVIQQLEEMRQAVFKADGDLKSLRKEIDDKKQGVNGVGVASSVNGGGGSASLTIANGGTTNNGQASGVNVADGPAED